MSSATPAGTRGYFEKLKASGRKVRSNALGATDLHVSRVGFGTYRVNEFDPDHREALKQALLGGCNLIDTSSNYGDGSSERMVGQVTNELFESGALNREEIVFVTKAGYVQGQNLKDARDRLERGAGFPDMVEFQPDCWHCISPSYLEWQITNSLARLKLDCIDFVLLHNPEYYMRGGGTRELYYQRIEKAFRHLESEAARGRIRHYGVSSNTFPEDEARSDFTSLTRVLELAKNAGGKSSHFALIQFPMNLFESGGALVRNNAGETVLELAARAKLGVLTNRPFNASQRGRLTRLTSFPKHDEVEVKGGLHVALGRAIELEKNAPGYPKAAPGLQWAHRLRDHLGDLDDLLTWREVLYQQIFPSIRSGLRRLNADRQSWAAEYQAAMQELLKLITWDLENLADQKSKIIEEQLILAAPPLTTSPSLSRKIVRLYTSLPQVNAVLVGMRTPNYVADILEAEEPALTSTEALSALSRFQRHRS